MGNRRLRLGIQENAVIGDREQAGQFMADDDDGGAETVPQLKDQIVEPAGGDRVEAGGRLVEEQNVGVEGQRPRQAGPLAHAAAEFGRKLVERVLHPDEAEFQPHQAADRGVVEAGEHAQRQRDVFAHCQCAPQRTALEQHAEAPADRGAARLGAGPVVLRLDQNACRRLGAAGRSWTSAPCSCRSRCRP